MKDYFPAMLDIAKQMFTRWERFGPDARIDVPDDMTRLTLDTIALCAFDVRLNSFYSEELPPFVGAMVKARWPELALAVVKDPRVARAPAVAEDLEALETDMLSGFVPARAAAGLSDGTTSSDVVHLEQVRAWFGRPLWEMEPSDTDVYLRQGAARHREGHPAGPGPGDQDVLPVRQAQGRARLLRAPIWGRLPA
ncbi:hypothetical protein GCM10010517_16170 [Streptosporangium fragile]|uniref:Uncharacterized protein n=1 Tax=Streptosporangium fragile TaxID=46186 RepID=A0ABP6I9B9_9ACTN